MAINEKAAGDSRHARAGKDGALYTKDGELIASVETFTSSVSFNNTQYSVLGDPQEHETSGTFAVTLTMTQVVIEDDTFIVEMMASLAKGEMPVWDFQGVLKGRNGTEQRVVYRDCIPSGEVDIQNLTVGETVKRNWSFFVNKPPKLQKLLSIK